jgi:ABC-type branched-subunit amino acid transport system ATPase component
VLGFLPALSEKLNVRASNLSGGQQTMLSVGRALMGEAKLLLLDEPCLGLDPVNVSRVINALKVAQAERGVSMLIAEQYWGFVTEFSARVIYMEGGELIFDGPLGEAVRAGLPG